MSRQSLRREEKFSQAAIRQQQAAWFLYVAEGFLANLNHAVRVNNFCLYNDDLEAIERLVSNVERDVANLRTTFFPE